MRVLREQEIRNDFAPRAKHKSRLQTERAGQGIYDSTLFFRCNSTLGIVSGIEVVEQFLGADHLTVSRSRN
jgi:hypothetical protein